MKLHPLAKQFPPLEAEELADLVADIKASGLREDITTLDGMILDGQNRQAACEAAGVKPRFDPYIGKDPVAFVISKNLKRRHLTTGQRAMIAAAIVDCQNSDTSIGKAAKSLHVSRQSIHIAKHVRRRSPALASKVRSGKISLNAAEEKLEPKTRIKNPILPSEPPEGFGGDEISRQLKPRTTITQAEFQKELDAIEKLIPTNADHKGFGVIANKFAERQMNFGKSKPSSYY